MATDPGAFNLLIDRQGVLTSPDGGAWVVDSSGAVTALTPPFTIPPARRARGVRPAPPMMDMTLFRGAMEPPGTWVEDNYLLLKRVRHFLPLPKEEGSVLPSYYLRNASNLKVLLGLITQVSGLLPATATVTRHWLDYPPTQRLPRYQQLNLGTLTCWGVKAEDQGAMRRLEHDMRLVSLLWISEDPFLIKSPSGEEMDGRKLMPDLKALVNDPRFSPYGILRYWAMRRFEHCQFGVEPRFDLSP